MGGVLGVELVSDVLWGCWNKWESGRRARKTDTSEAAGIKWRPIAILAEALQNALVFSHANRCLLRCREVAKGREIVRDTAEAPRGPKRRPGKAPRRKKGRCGRQGLCRGRYNPGPAITTAFHPARARERSAWGLAGNIAPGCWGFVAVVVLNVVCV